jgi:hypothetical protein
MVWNERRVGARFLLALFLMKKTMLLLIVGGFLLPAHLLAGTAPPYPRLAGFVQLPGLRAALLETVPTLSGRHFLIQREGQRDGDLESLQIDPQAGTVKLRVGRTNSVLTLSLRRQAHQPETGVNSLELVDVDLEPVLDLYAECKGRTLLRWPRLPATSFTLNASTPNRARAGLVLEKALAEKGIDTIPDGEKFLMIVPESEAATVRPHSAEIESPTGNGGEAGLLPAGAINIPNADLNIVAKIYADLIQRKLDQTQRLALPTLAIKFQNLSPLSKEECAYALETLFRWQGVRLVPAGDGLAKVVPIPKSEP